MNGCIHHCHKDVERKLFLWQGSLVCFVFSVVYFDNCYCKGKKLGYITCT